MANERRGDRRQGRPGGGGGYGDFRQQRSRPPRPGGFRGGFAQEGPPREFPPRAGRGPYPPRPPEGDRYGSRESRDEGGMAIRVDPRRLALLKELAAAQGLRPGLLVQRWVEERLDAERSGQPMQAGTAGGGRLQELEASIASLTSRIDEVTGRLGVLESSALAPTNEISGVGVTKAPAAPRRRGRPPKQPAAAGTPARPRRSRSPRRRPSAQSTRKGRVGLHDEIIAVIQERGPSTASELAGAIRERGRYRAPRSAKPLDAATVNSRVSNPVYRGRFRRAEGRIGLAE